MYSKVEGSDKFYSGRRKFGFPEESFIELTLSEKEASKVRCWEKEGHSIVPVWYANCKRVLFVDKECFVSKKRRENGEEKKNAQ